MLDMFYFNGYIIFDEIIYNTYNKIMINIINAIKIMYELKKPTIIQNNYIYFEVIDETDYEKLMIYIKYASNITPIRFYWISSCIRFILYTTY